MSSNIDEGSDGGSKPIQATSLLDYANQYMANMKISTSPNIAPNFMNVRPNLNFNFRPQQTVNKLENLMPQLSLNNKENVPDSSDCDDEIDLSIAIIKKPIEVTKTRPKTEQEVEVFVLPAIPDDDCVIPTVPEALKKASILPCLLYNNDLVKTNKSYDVCSSMGKVLCRQFRKRRVPYMDLRYHEKVLNIKVFKFDVPSPDEKILEKLKRK